MCNDKKTDQMVHQIDIYKSLLLYEEGNGPRKHEEEISWS